MTTRHRLCFLMFLACGHGAQDPQIDAAYGEAGEQEGDSALESTVSLDMAQPRGREIVHHGSEICVLPTHIPGAKFTRDDSASETELCGYDFYGDDTLAICPKVVSTNPGVDIERPQGMTKAAFEAAECLKSTRPSKTLAKFKQSITCSYTPSILGYYHLSRALGGLGGVKPAVIRTMQVSEHRHVTAKGLHSAIREFWQTYAASEANPAASRYRNTIYTSDLHQIYGALQENLRGETRYSPINVRSSGPDISVAFRNTQAWREVVDSRALADFLPRTLEGAAQRITRMGDIADMALIDTLMSQQDRYGNIHAVDYYYTFDNGDVKRVKKKDVDDGEKPMPAGGVLVREMRLKDNDCGGPRKTNVAKRARMIESVRHMRPSTYAHFRWLRAELEDPASPIASILQSEATFSEVDVKMLRDNATYAFEALDRNCRSGALKLDLDLVGHITQVVAANDCNFAAPPDAPF